MKYLFLVYCLVLLIIVAIDGSKLVNHEFIDRSKECAITCKMVSVYYFEGSSQEMALVEIKGRYYHCVEPCKTCDEINSILNIECSCYPTECASISYF